ncbi:HNH endonuclease family protein [Streptomyces decoyicus]|uniref:HNH endonuclease family protein n=1 Tax=Streptomyces decoyicus TaxID=249567 RepID=A0ABZ1FDP6_9ACTN|nr:HNH endonuclease family protein [Streptomyces decoyicus]WSB68208.1 HNH endonuclease family protein [Streptomyces decoyicus]
MSLAACGPATSHDDANSSTGSTAGPPEGKAGKGVSLSAAIDNLKAADEHRTGYERDKFRLWDDADHDGCDTRQEVLIAEAVKKPREGKSCRLTGGSWKSYYDGKTLTNARQLDIDHVVPLAEAWDSGASKWTAERRELYANDLDSDRSLVAVSLGSNRSKGDKDPAEWMPPSEFAACTYVTDWVAAKLRWRLTADGAEKTKLKQVAASCPNAKVSWKVAR